MAPFPNNRLAVPRWVSVLFVVVQLIGVLCAWLDAEVPSAIGVPMWAVGFFALMPGNLVGSSIVQAFLWRSRMSPVGLSVIVTLLAVATNAVAWFVLARAVVAAGSGLRLAKRGQKLL